MVTDGLVCKSVRERVFVWRTSEASVVLACSGMVSLACRIAVQCRRRLVYISKSPCWDAGAKYCTAASSGRNISRCSSTRRSVSNYAMSR